MRHNWSRSAIALDQLHLLFIGNPRKLIRFMAAAIILLLGGLVEPLPVLAQAQPSTCMAIAQSLPGATYASLMPAAYTPSSYTPSSYTPSGVRPQLVQSSTSPKKVQAPLANHEVKITYQGHSTYQIESADGVTIATDYSGLRGTEPPRVVTMNHAHDTHYTDYPDPEIEHVLRGWGTDEDVAKHYLTVGDVLIRNVTTDTLFGNLRTPNDNSIFIFEVAGLCIGHLGHLHHELTDEHYAKIGRLDVVMVPIDGAMTLSLGGMAKTVKRLHSSVILPMHARGWATPADFINMLGEGFDFDYLKSREIIISLFDLPKRPTVIVPQGL